MKTLLIYSSLSGNTKKIAETMACALSDCTLAPVSEHIAEQDFDILIFGYWVDRGMPDEKSAAFLQNVKNCRVILFGTLGASVESEHAKACMQKAEMLLLDPPRNNVLCASWLCQGKVDPKLLGPMDKMSDERRERILAAQQHPNEEDCIHAQGFICDAMKNIATTYHQ